MTIRLLRLFDGLPEFIYSLKAFSILLIVVVILLVIPTMMN